ncbi:hypothetical protein T190_16980 [Sinorhizobium meliloti CCBAU 01290]|nr:hypothetical protein T190_16980 [Sinorhizobium meliloti CCBAU 01290]
MQVLIEKGRHTFMPRVFLARCSFPPIEQKSIILILKQMAIVFRYKPQTVAEVWAAETKIELGALRGKTTEDLELRL